MEVHDPSGEVTLTLRNLTNAAGYRMCAIGQTPGLVRDKSLYLQVNFRRGLLEFHAEINPWQQPTRSSSTDCYSPFDCEPFVSSARAYILGLLITPPGLPTPLAVLTTADDGPDR